MFLLVSSRHAVSVGFLLCRYIESQTGVGTLCVAVGVPPPVGRVSPSYFALSDHPYIDQQRSYTAVHKRVGKYI